MKNLIYIAIAFLSASALAQTTNIKTSGTHFTKAIQDKSWSNETSAWGTVDQFSDFTGEAYVTFYSEVPAKISFDYVLNLTKGDCDVVFSGNGNSYNLAHISLGSRGTGVNYDTRTFEIEPGKEYRLIVKGEKSKGKFKCNWTEL